MKKKNIIFILFLILFLSSCYSIKTNDDFLFDIRIKEGRYNYKTSFSIGNTTIDSVELLFDKTISIPYPCPNNELIDYSFVKEKRFKWNFHLYLCIQGESFYYSVEKIEYLSNEKNIYTLKNVKCPYCSLISFDEIKLNLVNTNEDIYAEEIKINFLGYESDISLINTSIKHKVEFTGMVELIDYSYSKSETLTYYYDFETVCFILKLSKDGKIPYIIDQDGNRLDHLFAGTDTYYFYYDMIDKDVILDIKI